MRYLMMWILLCSTVFGQADAVITGPDEAELGDLIILSSEKSKGDSFAWMLANSNKSFLQFDEGSKCVFASGTPGIYTFILAVSKADDGIGSTISISKHSVVVGVNPNPNPQPDVPGPGPDVPDVPDVPSPNPTPDLEGNEKLIFEAWRKDKPPRHLVEAVLENFESVASKAVAVSGFTTDDMLSDLLSKNRADIKEEDQSKLISFGSQFSKIMGGTTSKPTAVRHFNEVIEATKVYLKWSSPSRTSSSGKSNASTLIEAIDKLTSKTGDMRNKIGNLNNNLEEADSRLNGIFQEVGQ